MTGLAAGAQQPGRVKVSFAGFKCLRETVDDMLQKDGKGDEVFFQFYFTMAGQNGVTKLQYAVPSDIYGDATGPFSNRISAGGDVLTVVPTVWEWDPGTGLQSAFDATITGACSQMNQLAWNISNQQLNAPLGNAGNATSSSGAGKWQAKKQ